MHNRQSTRLKGYDYSHKGAYFITIVSQNREERFGKIVNSSMFLNNIGKMIQSVWCDLPNQYPSIVLDSFVIMPNHFHGVIILNDNNTNEKDEHEVRPLNNHPNGTSPNTIGRIIQTFKSITTHRYINGVKLGLIPWFYQRIWQRNYYEHIIRNENEYHHIKEYIIDNPINWHKDRYCQ